MNNKEKEKHKPDAIYYHESKPIFQEDIENALKEVGLKKGDIVMVHSDLRTFGKMGDVLDKKQFIGLILEAFLNVLGKEGTLVVPTYTYSFCGSQVFDVKQSKSTVGTFTEFVRNHKDAIRSEDPIFSHAAIGKDAERLMSNVSDICFGKDSFFDRLYKYNGKIINFGRFFDITYMHYIEKNLGAPYRFDKKFSGTTVQKDGNRIQKEVTYFCNYYFIQGADGNKLLQPTCQILENALEEKGLINKVSLGKSEIICSKARDCYDVAFEIYKKDKFSFIQGVFTEIDYDENIDKTNYVGLKMYYLMQKLFPITRSITGEGVRETLKIIKEHIPIKIHEVPSGTKVFDWEIPKEWNIKDAYIKNSRGEKIIDFKKSNLHVLNYSIPIHEKMSLDKLKKHLFTLPEYPDWIPYLSSYYNENWGFCLTHNQYKKLEDDIYEVFIDSSLEQGSLTFGELYIKGRTEEEVLFSCYLCHPSLCNDNLSGIVLLTFLVKQLLNSDLKYSYRFLFIPETIGAITWLSLNEGNISKIKHGLVATCVGDSGNFTYQKSKVGNAEIDKIVEKVLIDSKQQCTIRDFSPCGSDERQFCSPGFNLPIGSLMRTPYDLFSEYHTSADNLEFIKPDFLADSLEKYHNVIFILENNKTYINLNPKCEPQLGKRGLYSLIGGEKPMNLNRSAILWVLNFSDGTNSLLDISILSGISFLEIKKAADALDEKGLLRLCQKNKKRD